MASRTISLASSTTPVLSPLFSTNMSTILKSSPTIFHAPSYRVRLLSPAPLLNIHDPAEVLHGLDLQPLVVSSTVIPSTRIHSHLQSHPMVASTILHTSVQHPPHPLSSLWPPLCSSSQWPLLCSSSLRPPLCSSSLWPSLSSSSNGLYPVPPHNSRTLFLLTMASTLFLLTMASTLFLLTMASALFLFILTFFLLPSVLAFLLTLA